MVVVASSTQCRSKNKKVAGSQLVCSFRSLGLGFCGGVAADLDSPIVFRGTGVASTGRRAGGAWLVGVAMRLGPTGSICFLLLFFFLFFRIRDATTASEGRRRKASERNSARGRGPALVYLVPPGRRLDQSIGDIHTGPLPVGRFGLSGRAWRCPRRLRLTFWRHYWWMEARPWRV